VKFKWVAVHEAAHVIAACHYKKRFKRVVVKNMTQEEWDKDPIKGYVKGLNSCFALRKTIDQRWERICKEKGFEAALEHAFDDCVMLVSALIATKKYLNAFGPLRRFGYTDANEVDKLINLMFDNEEDKWLFIIEVIERSKNLVEERWQDIMDLAEVLYEKEDMSRKQVKKQFPHFFS